MDTHFLYAPAEAVRPAPESRCGGSLIASVSCSEEETRGESVMPVARLILLLAALLTQIPSTAALRAQEAGSPEAAALDFEYFRSRIQPIFLLKREGNARCVSCHIHGTPMRLQELSAGAVTWTEEQSRLNMEVVTPRVVPHNLPRSILLQHPLASEGGGSFYHSGGKHWNSFLEPEWQTIAKWVCGHSLNDPDVELPGVCLD
jgi:hypothetical protein